MAAHGARFVYACVFYDLFAWFIHFIFRSCIQYDWGYLARRIEFLNRTAQVFKLMNNWKEREREWEWMSMFRQFIFAFGFLSHIPNFSPKSVKFPLCHMFQKRERERLQINKYTQTRIHMNQDKNWEWAKAIRATTKNPANFTYVCIDKCTQNVIGIAQSYRIISIHRIMGVKWVSS